MGCTDCKDQERPSTSTMHIGTIIVGTKMNFGDMHPRRYDSFCHHGCPVCLPQYTVFKDNTGKPLTTIHWCAFCNEYSDNYIIISDAKCHKCGNFPCNRHAEYHKGERFCRACR
jgi:hypothetical protein